MNRLFQLSTLTISVMLSHIPAASGQGCCSGGSGSPIAGNSAQGVLRAGQLELATSYQYMNSNRFLTGDRQAEPLFRTFQSHYMYSRVAYGLNEKLTLSVENGYFFNKKQVGLEGENSMQSHGTGDLIIFPRYDVFNRKTLAGHNELTLGLGYKIPLGSHNDSHVVYTSPSTGRQYYTISPPLIQTTTGSHDIIFYLFYMHSSRGAYKFFSNAMYIRKGWNSLGEKFGDYASLNLFVSRKLLKNTVMTLQLNAENIGVMQYNKNIDLLALYNVDVNSTGSRKLSLIPQLSYSVGSLTFFGMGEIPLYQYVHGTQVAVRQQFTMGLAYRFQVVKDALCADSSTALYECPMHCKGGGSDRPGTCGVCGMVLEKQDVKK